MDLPIIGRYEHKTDQYMFGHRVLPYLLYHEPALLQEILADDAAAQLKKVWDHYTQTWKVEGGDHTVAVKWYGNDDGALAVLVDLPNPTSVPDPHGAVIVLSPERAYFPMERASDADVLTFERGSWFRVSNDATSWTEQGRPAYMGEWTADGAHRNHGFTQARWSKILLGLSSIIGTDDLWKELTDEEWESMRPIDLALIPVRMPERALSSELVQAIDDEVQAILRTAVDAESSRRAALVLSDHLRALRRQHGNNSAEITLHMAHVVRLLLEAGDFLRAHDVAADWGKYCIAERGSRAPETRIAYTWLARTILADHRFSKEEREKRASLRTRMRDRLPGGMRHDLPGADDPDTEAQVLSGDAVR
jgi:hypothetical protein